MNIQALVEQSCYEALSKNNPELIEAIADLLSQGETPDQIHQKLSGQYPNFADWSRAAAAYMERNGETLYRPVEPAASRKITRRELIVLALDEAIAQMKRIGDELAWSEPIDEGYIQALHSLRGVKISLTKTPRK